MQDALSRRETLRASVEALGGGRVARRQLCLRETPSPQQSCPDRREPETDQDPGPSTHTGDTEKGT